MWFVGDSIDDMQCGKAAGCRTCLVRTPHNTDLQEKFPGLVDVAVSSLQEFADYIGLPMDV